MKGSMAALRATKYWRSMLMNRLDGGNRSFTAYPTIPKMKSYSTTAGSSPGDHQSSTLRSLATKGEYAPIYIVMGFVVVAVTIAAHTAKQNLFHAPGVAITKKRRGSISEADEPDVAVTSATKFLNKSFLRKVAHIQENKATISDSRPDQFATHREPDSLKTSGVNTSRN